MDDAQAPAEVVVSDVSYRAVETGAGASDALRAGFAAAWPSYLDWFLRDGEEPRPTYAEGRHALAVHMPELLGTYDLLTEAVGGGDLEARFLSHWCPPPLFAACSMVTWPSASMLLRNYDYPPAMCDATMLAASWGGVRTVAMADCTWGALDGINEHGLAVAISFGGRPVVGDGFGIGLIVRYLLQVTATVVDALAVLDRVPVRMPYNVALLDAAGGAAVAFISPDRPMVVSDRLSAANRQGTSEWPEYEEFCGTLERETLLDESVALGPTAEQLLDRMLTPPVFRSTADSPWGTVYTSVYDTNSLSATLAWPGTAWKQSLWDFEEGVQVRSMPIHVPPEARIHTGHGPTHRPLLIA